MLINSQMRILHQSGIVLCGLKTNDISPSLLISSLANQAKGIEENSHVRTYTCFIYCYFSSMVPQ